MASPRGECHPSLHDIHPIRGPGGKSTAGPLPGTASCHWGRPRRSPTCSGRQPRWPTCCRDRLRRSGTRRPGQSPAARRGPGRTGSCSRRAAGPATPTVRGHVQGVERCWASAMPVISSSDAATPAPTVLRIDLRIVNIWYSPSDCEDARCILAVGSRRDRWRPAAVAF